MKFWDLMELIDCDEEITVLSVTSSRMIYKGEKLFFKPDEQEQILDATAIYTTSGKITIEVTTTKRKQ